MMLEVCDLDRPTSAPASACVSPRPPSRSAIVGGYAIGRDGDGTFSRFLGGAFSLGVMRVGSWTSSKRLSRYLIGSLVSFICVHSVDWASFRPAPRPRASTPSPADNLSNPEKRHWTNVGRLGRPRRLTWRSCPYWREKILVLGSSRLFGLGRNTTFSRKGRGGKRCAGGGAPGSRKL